MSKKLNKIFVTVSVMAVVACSPKGTQITDTAGQDSSAISVSEDSHTETDVPYTVAKNYFVKNTVKPGQLGSPKITSQEQFDSFFGSATTMGIEGQPTPIDFSKQYVMAYIGNETDYPTVFDPQGLKQSGGNITLSFQIREKETKQSFTIVPFLAVIVDKQYEGEPQVEFFQVK